jgi:hypothetical protein
MNTDIIVSATPEELTIAVRVMAISARHRNTYFNKLLTEWLDDMEGSLEYAAAYYDEQEGQSYIEDCVYESEIAHEYSLTGGSYY